jgi:hypothetical protein
MGDHPFSWLIGGVVEGVEKVLRKAPVTGDKADKEIDCAYFDVFQMFLVDEPGGRNTSNRYGRAGAYQLVPQAQNEFRCDRIDLIVSEYSPVVKARFSSGVRLDGYPG